MGVIPNNQDPELLNFLKRKFLDKSKRMAKKGWEISMHGYSHEYGTDTNRKDFSNLEVNQSFW